MNTNFFHECLAAGANKLLKGLDVENEIKMLIL